MNQEENFIQNLNYYFRNTNEKLDVNNFHKIQNYNTIISLAKVDDNSYFLIKTIDNQEFRLTRIAKNFDSWLESNEELKLLKLYIKYLQNLSSKDNEINLNDYFYC